MIRTLVAALVARVAISQSTVNWYESAKYTIAGTESAFGQSVSIYGELFAVSAPDAEISGARTGSVTVYDLFEDGPIASVRHYNNEFI
jgi:hypothetical protein